MAARALTGEILWVVAIVAVIPWRYVYADYLSRRGGRWRALLRWTRLTSFGGVDLTDGPAA